MTNLNFDTAYDELNSLLNELQSEELSIESLAVKAKRASELIEFCKDRLRSIEDEIQDSGESPTREE